MALLDRLQKDKNTVVATATLATLATDKPIKPVTVAKVARIAVANTQIEKYRLLTGHRKKLLDYLAAIDETDPEMIDELLTECGKDADKLAWALQWAEKVLANQSRPEQSLVTCRSCRHFQCYNAHGRGAGGCAAGVAPIGVCHWSETPHECGKYQVLRLKNDE